MGNNNNISTQKLRQTNCLVPLHYLHMENTENECQLILDIGWWNSENRVFIASHKASSIKPKKYTEPCEKSIISTKHNHPATRNPHRRNWLFRSKASISSESRKKTSSRNKMPTWLRKRFTKLKEELLNLGGKHRTRTNTSKRKRNAGECSAQIEPSIRMIHNRLTTTQRIRDKSETNAYRDYAKWRDGVTINQNNYASYRGACTAAPNSCCDNETLSPATGTGCDKSPDKCRTVNELVSSRRLDCDERCASESELIAHFFHLICVLCLWVWVGVYGLQIARL